MKSNFWKRNKSLRVILLVGFILIISTILFEMRFATSYYPNRVMYTRASLSKQREGIDVFKAEYGRFPSSLDEASELKERNSGVTQRKYKEYISKRDGITHEKKELDGTGGWYYDKETGQVRVNLDQPLKYYLKYAFTVFPLRNEKPCDW